MDGSGPSSHHWAWAPFTLSLKIAELHLALATGPWPLEALQKAKKWEFSECKTPASFPWHER